MEIRWQIYVTTKPVISFSWAEQVFVSDTSTGVNCVFVGNYFPLWINRHLTCCQCLQQRRECVTWETAVFMFTVMSEHVTQCSTAGHWCSLCVSGGLLYGCLTSYCTMMENYHWTSDVNPGGFSFLEQINTLMDNVKALLQFKSPPNSYLVVWLLKKY